MIGVLLAYPCWRGEYCKDVVSCFDVILLQ